MKTIPLKYSPNFLLPSNYPWLVPGSQLSLPHQLSGWNQDFQHHPVNQIIKDTSFMRAFKTTAYLHKVFIFVFPTKNNLSYLHESSVGANRLKQDKLNLLINGKENGNVAFNFEQTEHKLCLNFSNFKFCIDDEM